MNEIEEKYKKFGLTDELLTQFRDYSVGINDLPSPVGHNLIQTVLLEKGQAVSEEKPNAKLV